MTNVLRTHLEMARGVRLDGYLVSRRPRDSDVFGPVGTRPMTLTGPGSMNTCAKKRHGSQGPRGLLAEYLGAGLDTRRRRGPSQSPMRAQRRVATTLEYAWDDYAMALFAKKLGKADDYRMFLARAGITRTYLTPAPASCVDATRTARGFRHLTRWSRYYNFMMKRPAAGKRCGCAARCRRAGELLGGREKFCAKLDDFFTFLTIPPASRAT